MASFVKAIGCPRQTSMGLGVSGWQFCPREKRGTGVGVTKVGQGSTVMTVTNGHGLPIGLHLAVANHHEVTLAEATLRTMKVSQKRGRPRTRPQELVTDTAYDSRQVRHALRQCSIKVTMPTFEWRKRKKPQRGRPIKVGPSYQSRWKVARCFGWMDHCRRLVVRYDRYRSIYRSFCLLAPMRWSIDRILKQVLIKEDHTLGKKGMLYLLLREGFVEIYE